jgi:hypothetical protein
MNYSNHDLRTNLQEWKNRLYRSTYGQFGNQIKYLLTNFKSNKQIAGILLETKSKYPFDIEALKKVADEENDISDIKLENEIQQTAFCHQFLDYFTSNVSYDLHHYLLFQRNDFGETRDKIIEDLISPIIYFLHDKLDKANSIIYLLEKYKRRTEWFTKNDLLREYTSALKNYEQIFEDDLRLFLFDQGIDYPFSTPLSASGRADIIGEIETDDPLVVEIKIFDRNKNYGKDRIKDGFTQVLKYANDYNKDVGYLVIYNLDKAELNLAFNESNNMFPTSINFNNKTFYLIIINLNTGISASKQGTTEVIEFKEEELFNK